MADSQRGVDIKRMVGHTMEACARVEGDLGIPSGFISELPSETDWTFIVKAGAIVEAALNQFLLAAVADQRLHAGLLRLRLGGRDGKLWLAKDLALLSQRDVRFVERISSLRNSAVHNVHSFSLSFESLLGDLTPQERRQFWRDIFDLVADDKINLDRLLTRPGDVRLVVWISLVFFLDRLHINKTLVLLSREQENMKQEADAVQANTFRELLQALAPLRDDAGGDRDPAA